MALDLCFLMATHGADNTMSVISLLEALKLAHNILMNAEQERLVAAETEATTGIQYED